MKTKSLSSRASRADAIMLIVLLAFSFLLSYKAGERGFLAIDQSIVFDGSYRILSGQIPYKDFVIPFGPVVFWLQALFFRLFGISYTSYLLGAAFVNVLATTCSVIILRMLFPEKRLLSFLAGFLTAIWFYSLFGTPFAEQTGFFFALLALTILLFAKLDIGLHPFNRKLLLFTSGCIASVSFLSKQNTGLFILPLFVFLTFAVDWPNARRAVCGSLFQGAGFALGLGAFIVYVWSYSGLNNFLTYFWRIPSNTGAERIFGNPLALVVGIVAGPVLRSNSLALLVPCLVAFGIASALVIAMYLRLSQSEKETSLGCFVGGILCISLVLFQNIFIVTADNQPHNGLAFIGLIMAIGVGMLSHLQTTALQTSQARLSGKTELVHKFFALSVPKMIVAICIALSVVYAATLGLWYSWSRSVHDIFRDSEFPRYVAAAGLEGLRWGVPTAIDGIEITDDDLVGVLQYLRNEKRNFVVFPDFTIFYALVGTRSPQPVLWFHKGLTYPDLYDLELDRWIVKDLQENEVQIVILEEKSEFGTEERLSHFPLMKSYIQQSFSRVNQIGVFSIYDKRFTGD